MANALSEIRAGMIDCLPPEAGGILVVDKPEGLTSAQATATVKRLLRPRKIGHTGTLDPFATGVLVLCLNEATRAADQITDLAKVYLATLRFGVETDTLDCTGRVIAESDRICSGETLLEALVPFQGKCVQKVPRYSAVHVAGRRLYELSRKGIEVDRPEREVHVHSIALRSFAWPEAVIEVCCSKGTYIRQLASDIGGALQCGAHLSALRRVSVGPFDLECAIALDSLRDYPPGSGWIGAGIIALNEALSHLPSAEMGGGGLLARLRNGQLDPEWERERMEDFSDHSGAVRIVTDTHRLAALWWPKSVGAGSRRLRVFPF
ncbi:MAG: tRNA pseudouridine(55) synthase TruB [Desulfobacteraceae bacterium]|nr:tRNA pseudouridine(55) synthase TruB [Desulfobacteraceae bacterium]